MAKSDMRDEPLERKAIRGVMEELARQSAENPARLKVRRSGDRVIVDGELDVDAIVMVVIGAMAGGP